VIRRVEVPELIDFKRPKKANQTLVQQNERHVFVSRRFVLGDHLIPRLELMPRLERHRADFLYAVELLEVGRRVLVFRRRVG